VNIINEELLLEDVIYSLTIFLNAEPEQIKPLIDKDMIEDIINKMFEAETQEILILSKHIEDKLC
jgi:dTDP-glucose pyrophosphorylase